MNRVLLLFASLAAMLTSCSYSFRGQTAGEIRSIAIPTIVNESTDFGLAEVSTEELISGFQKDGTLRVTSEGNADAVIVARLTQVNDEPFTARAGQDAITVDEYRFSMTCVVELVIAESGQTKWTQSFSPWAVYPYGGDLSNREGAIEEATTKLVEDLLNKIVGAW